MKLPSPLLLLSVAAFLATYSIVAADTFDSEDATIQKAGDKTAKVKIEKKTYTAPISFADGTDWSAVKDHYEVDPSVVPALEANKLAISIGADGTASFTKTKK